MSACMVRIFFPFFEPLALASTHSSRSFTLESKHSSASQMLSRSSFSRSFRAASTRIASSRSLLLMSPRKLRNRSVGPPANPPPSTISWDISIAGAGALAWPTTLAGAPATIACGATGLSTNDPAAIMAPLPTVMLPKTVECAPMSTPFPIFGCLSPTSFPVPPSVTPCRMDTLSPTTAVSPMTTPVPWSMSMPLPSRAAGWRSMANTVDILACMVSASRRWPLFHKACWILCACNAWKPLR